MVAVALFCRGREKGPPGQENMREALGKDKYQRPAGASGPTKAGLQKARRAKPFSHTLGEAVLKGKRLAGGSFPIYLDFYSVELRNQQFWVALDTREIQDIKHILHNAA